jgi:2-polyprenyl-3-methyl-5-hydroxy-6-metoxy-1,4-benzoquinol methylase
MSQRFKIKENANQSKNTRLGIAEDFATARFNRDELAHVSRYLFVAEQLVSVARELGRPITILDIGCGEIWTIRVFFHTLRIKKAEIVENYTGFDLDEKALSRADSFKFETMSVSLVQGDITEGDLKQFPDKSKDVVICLETIEHIKPEFVPLLLSEIKRICRGRAYISTPNFDGGIGSIPDDHIKEWCYAELSEEIKKAGLRVIREIGVFSNLNKVEALAKDDPKLRAFFEFFKDKFDGNFLSIVMAKFIQGNAQNILRICE